MSRFTITCPLVGDHARQGAKTMLAHLPSGTELQLCPEGDNPYDSNAVKVLVRPEAIPASQHDSLAETLPASGMSLEEVLAGEDFWLGYLAATGGKPLAREREATGLDLQGNVEALAAMADREYSARLEFGPAGKALVNISYGEREKEND